MRARNRRGVTAWVPLCSIVARVAIALSMSLLFISSASAGLYSSANASITDSVGCTDISGTQPVTASASCPIGWVTNSVEDLTIKSFMDLDGVAGLGRTQGNVSDAFYWDPLSESIIVSMAISLSGETTEPFRGLSFNLNFSLSELIEVGGNVTPSGTAASGRIYTTFLEDTDPSVSIDPSSGNRIFDLTQILDLTLSADAVGVLFNMGHQSEVRSGGLADYGHTAEFQLTVPDALASGVTRDSGFAFINGGETGGTVPVPTTLALFAIGLAGLGWSRRKKA